MNSSSLALPPLSGPHVELDILELWVGDLGKVRRIMTSMFGFMPYDMKLTLCADEEAACLTCGNVGLIIREDATDTSPVARYVAKHGDSVVDVALVVCGEVQALVDRALAHGLKVSHEKGCPQIDLLGDGTILHSLRDHRSIIPRSESGGLHDELQIRSIDHVTYCLPWGTMDRVVRAYEEVFALEKIQVENVQSEQTEDGPDHADGMRSVALRSPLDFTVVLTEPMSSASIGQTQQFLDAHVGPGIQHVAFAYEDLVAAVEALRTQGVSFLSIPEEHLKHSCRRLHDCPLSWDALRRNEILVDADENGLLFQVFTRPLTDRASFFIELIQREGATGFGATNIRALYAAIEAAMRDPEKGLWRPAVDDRAARHTAWTKQLVRTARSRVPFYRDHLTDLDVTCLASLPTFEKSMTVGYGRFPLSAGGAPGAHRVLATSGTSGHRLYVSFDQDEWNRTANWLEQVGRRVGLSSKDVLLNTHCYGLWVGGPALDLLANRIGAGLVPVGPGGLATALELLADGVGTAISATPSYLRRLIEAAQASHMDLTKTALRVGFIGAEPAEESLRRNLMLQLPDGFKWIELYGLTETGGPSVAFAPDPDVPELELNTQDYWAEVLDPTADRPVPMGEVGELTLTTKRTDGRTPLVRYRTRDLVRATAGNPEAPTRISRFLGRVDESLKVGGVLVYPSAIADIMFEFLPATAEWRAWVRPREPDNELLVEAEVPQDLCHTLERAFLDRIGLGLTITPTQAGALERSRRKTQRILVESLSADPSRLNGLPTEQAR